MTPISSIALELGTTDRTIRRAVNDGLIRADRLSPRKASLSANERVYLRRYWPLLAQIRAALRTEPNVRAAVLFGSAARGAMHETSDVDLLVEIDKDVPTARLRLRHRLENSLGRSVQIVSTEAAGSAPLLMREILDDGRPIIDRSGLWDRLKAEEPSLRRAAARYERDLDRRFSQIPEA